MKVVDFLWGLFQDLYWMIKMIMPILVLATWLYVTKCDNSKAIAIGASVLITILFITVFVKYIKRLNSSKRYDK